MDEKLARAIDLMSSKFREEFGEDAQLENGEEMVGVFKDCAIKISLDNNNLKVDVHMGEPMIFEETIFEGE